MFIGLFLEIMLPKQNGSGFQATAISFNWDVKAPWPCGGLVQYYLLAFGAAPQRGLEPATSGGLGNGFGFRC